MCYLAGGRPLDSCDGQVHTRPAWSPPCHFFLRCIRVLEVRSQPQEVLKHRQNTHPTSGLQRRATEQPPLVRLGDPGGPREAQGYTQPTSDIAQRRGPAIRTARRGSNSHLACRPHVRSGSDLQLATIYFINLLPASAEKHRDQQRDSTNDEGSQMELNCALS
jgi:hypothetical protein